MIDGKWRTMNPTSSSEANALLAVQNGDFAEAREHLAEYSVGELHALADVADDLSSLCGTLARDARAKEGERG